VTKGKGSTTATWSGDGTALPKTSRRPGASMTTVAVMMAKHTDEEQAVREEPHRAE
jgi:hypothetical protein